MGKYRKLMGMFCLGMAAATFVFINAGMRLGRALEIIDVVLEGEENSIDSGNSNAGYWKITIFFGESKDFIIIYYTENPTIWKKSARQKAMALEGMSIL